MKINHASHDCHCRLQVINSFYGFYCIFFVFNRNYTKMEEQTPIAEKVRKSSTPKTTLKSLKGTPNKFDLEIELKEASFELTNCGSNDSSLINVFAICTPMRITRLKAKEFHIDMSPQTPQTPSFVTPSKRNTAATSKRSAKRLFAKEQETAFDGEIGREKVPTIKVNDEILLALSIDQLATPECQDGEDRKADIVVEKREEYLPSVNILGRNSSAKLKFVRSCKSISGSDGADDERLPSVSVSMLGKVAVSTADDEDLPSSSILGSDRSPASSVQSSEWNQSHANAAVSNDDGNVVNKKRASVDNSIRNESPAIVSNENSSIDNNNLDLLISANSTSMPTLFRFGEDNKKPFDFRFNLLAPALYPTQNSKYIRT